LSALWRRSSSGLPSVSSSPSFGRFSIRSPRQSRQACDPPVRGATPVWAAGGEETALSGFGPDPRSIGSERANTNRTIQ
jgi:hypothetical protein